MEQEIGKITHYFDKAMAAVIKLNGDLAVGDMLKFVHGENEFTQKVESMQVDRKPIESGKAGEEVAVKVDQPVHEHTKVYKIIE